MIAVFAAAATVYFITFGLLVFNTGQAFAQFFVLVAFFLAGVSQYIVQSNDKDDVMLANRLAIAAMVSGVLALTSWIVA